MTLLRGFAATEQGATLLEDCNKFLDVLPRSDRQLLLSKCHPVKLPQKMVLCSSSSRPTDAYILNTGICSSVSVTAEGESAEVGVIGDEGIVNALLVLGPAHAFTQAVIQVDASGYRIPLVQLASLFRSSAEIHYRLLEYVQSQALAADQIAACHRLHSTEQRLARWLLMMHDRVGTKELNMTQAFLGLLLGIQRPTVTLVAQAMQKRGLIKLQRGKINIVSREKLEQAVCECYEVTRHLRAHLYKKSLPAVTHVLPG